MTSVKSSAMNLRKRERGSDGQSYKRKRLISSEEAKERTIIRDHFQRYGESKKGSRKVTETERKANS